MTRILPTIGAMLAITLAGTGVLFAAELSAGSKALDEANKLLGGTADVLTDALHSVNSRYFQVQGRQRQDQSVVEDRSIVQRDGLEVKTLWRTHEAPLMPSSKILPQ